MNRTKFLMEHFGLTKRPNPTYKQYFTFGELQKLLIDYDKAINYTRCCETLKGKHAQALFEYKQQLKETDNNDTLFIDNKEEWIRQTSVLSGKISVLEDL